MTNDMINGLFELCGAIAISASIRTLLRDRCYAGINVLQVTFFTLWGCWNVFYYPSINQYWSFVGGCLLATANLVYVGCLCWFPHKTSYSDYNGKRDTFDL